LAEVFEIVVPVATFEVVNAGGIVLEVVEQTASVFEIVEDGRIGLPGPAGPTSAPIQFTQSSPLATWVVSHNRGYRPSVAVTTPGGLEIEAAVLHLSLNVLSINFEAPQSGLAIIG
jgi:hypothetical protein